MTPQARALDLRNFLRISDLFSLQTAGEGGKKITMRRKGFRLRDVALLEAFATRWWFRRTQEGCSSVVERKTPQKVRTMFRQC